MLLLWPKEADRMAKSVDPEQTAPEGAVCSLSTLFLGRLRPPKRLTSTLCT